jgi:hypothetical protein
MAILIVVAGLSAVGASPAAAQQGPPPDVPQGPPTDVPEGPPTDVPEGPPTDVPQGPPTDLPGPDDPPEPPGDDGGGGGGESPEPPGDGGGGGGESPEPPGDGGGGGGESPEPPGDDGGGGGSPVETPSAGGRSGSGRGGSGGGGSGGGGSGAVEGSGSESCPCAAPATGYPVNGDYGKRPVEDGAPGAASSDAGAGLAASRSDGWSDSGANGAAEGVLAAGVLGDDALEQPTADRALLGEDWAATSVLSVAVLALAGLGLLVFIAGGVRGWLRDQGYR